MKSDKSIHTCLDACEVNQYLEADQEAPTLIEKIIQGHEGTKMFTSTDFTQGYNNKVASRFAKIYSFFRK